MSRFYKKSAQMTNNTASVTWSDILINLLSPAVLNWSIAAAAFCTAVGASGVGGAVAAEIEATASDPSP